MVGDLRASQISGREARCSAIHELTIYEGMLRRSRDGARIMRVGIIVIHVVNAVDVADESVMDVYVADVASAAVIPRVENFTVA